MATGYSVMDALNKQTKAGIDDTTPRAKFRTKDLSIFKIYANEGNFYPQEDIEQKAGEILAIGLLENLVVKYEPLEAAGEYELISGERRWRALHLLVERGYKEFEFVTCNIIAPTTSQEEKVALIIANSHRSKDIETMIHEEQELKATLEDMKANGIELKGYNLQSGRLRDVIADLLNISKTKVAQIEAVSNNLIPEFMEELNKNRLTFSAAYDSNISHDFRSPLTSIKGYLEAIEDGTVPPEMINKYINIVLFETERLTKLTSNILTLNELDPKTVRLEITTFDINSVIKHTIETLEGSCKKKGIKFSLTFSGTALNVKADKGKIQQVIYNLVDNAIKFSHDNSFIYVTVKEKGDKAQISIKDTGSGIAKKDIDKIWDRFYKSDASRGRDKKGSGLGLSITKEIIQAHEEHIDVISTPDV